MDSKQIKQLIDDHEHIVLFDGVCNLCSGWVQFLIKRDPNADFVFCPVQSDTGKALLNTIGLPTDHIETMAYIRNGEAFIRSTAFLKIVKKLTAAWPWLSFGLHVPKKFRDSIYNLIAKNRYRIAGKKERCLMPTEDSKARFLE